MTETTVLTCSIQSFPTMMLLTEQPTFFHV